MPELAPTEVPLENCGCGEAPGVDEGVEAPVCCGFAGVVAASCVVTLAASSKTENGWVSVCWAAGAGICDHCGNTEELLALTSDAELGTAEPLQSTSWRFCACNGRASADEVVSHVNSTC